MPTIISMGQTYTNEDVLERSPNCIQHTVIIEHPSDELTLDEVIECLVVPLLQGYGYYNVRKSLGLEE